MLSLLALPDFSHYSWLILSLILATMCFIWQKSWLVMSALAAGLLFGLWRGDNQLVIIQGYKPYFGQTVVLSGTIYEDVSDGKRSDKQVELSNVRINGQKLPEKVWISLRTKIILKRSDQLELNGKLQPGFGSFAASMNYAKVLGHQKGVDQARDIRDTFSRSFKQNVSEPESSLGVGFLVGQRSGLPPELDEQLRIVGLTHIVVASGYNLTILVRLARRLLAQVSKYLTAVVSFFMIAGFLLVTGFSPSMSRAALVAGLSFLAWYWGRKISPFVLLPLAAAITLIINPSFAWGDIGWYLSFAAFGGVMIVAPLLQDYFFGITKPGFVRQVLGETVAALLATAPLILLIFGQYSPYALLANLLVVPLIPYIMLAVLVGGVTSLVVPLVASFFSWPAVVLLHYVTSISNWIAHFPGAQQEGIIDLLGLASYYVALVGVSFYMWYRTKHNFRNNNLID